MTTKSGYRSLRLLFIDDDVDLHKLVAAMLRPAGHLVLSAFSGDEGLRMLASEKVDMVVLDIMMPRKNGLSVLVEIRQNNAVPVLMLTAISERDIIEEAFYAGADDYLVKPFSVKDFLSRVERLTTLLPESSFGGDGVIRCGKHTLLPESHQFMVGRYRSELSIIETRLMQHFLSHPGSLISSEDLIEIGWGRKFNNPAQDKEMLRLAMNRLRSKIEPDKNHPVYLPLINEEGYYFHATE